MKKLSTFLSVILSFAMIFGLFACQDDDSIQPKSFPYSVSFQTDGGSKVDAKNIDVITYQPTSIKENYVLEGWYFDKEKTIKADFPLSVDTNMTLYAKWKESLKSMRERFDAYMTEKDNLVEKTYMSGNFEYSYKITTIGKFITCEWERVYTSPSNSSYKATYNYNISFEFGDFSTAKGRASFVQKTGSQFSCQASFNFYSARIEGNTHLLNLNNTDFYDNTTLNFTLAQIEEDIQSALLGCLNDIRTLAMEIGLTFYIIDYDYTY